MHVVLKSLCLAAADDAALGSLQHSGPPTSPMALLTAIVRKEALLPEHTAAFAATQLLPVIQAATERHLAACRASSADRAFLQGTAGERQS